MPLSNWAKALWWIENEKDENEHEFSCRSGSCAQYTPSTRPLLCANNTLPICLRNENQFLVNTPPRTVFLFSSPSEKVKKSVKCPFFVSLYVTRFVGQLLTDVAVDWVFGHVQLSASQLRVICGKVIFSADCGRKSVPTIDPAIFPFPPKILERLGRISRTVLSSV